MRAHRSLGAALLSAVVLVSLAPSASAASGDLDPSFSGDGTFVTRPFLDTGEDIALQHGGRILSVGQAFHGLDSFGVIRIRADGTRDPRFGTDGQAVIPIPQPAGGCFEPIAEAVATTADGHILVAGDGCGRIAVARLDHDGALDPTFGSDGLALTDVRGLTDVTDMALDPAGHIYVAGDNRAGDVVVARYRRGGAPDTRFARDGLRVVSVPGDAHVEAVALRDGGSVVVAGRTYRSPTYPLLRPFVAQLLANSGKLDPSFGAEGVTVVNVEGAFTDLALDQGLPVGVGWIGRDVLTARFTPQGLPDTTFGAGGLRRGSFTTGCCDAAFGVAVASSGDVIVAGCAGCSAQSDQHGLGVLAYSEDGELDPAFGQAGGTVTLGLPDWLVTSGPRGGVRVDDQGRIVVGAATSSFGPGVFARYLP